MRKFIATVLSVLILFSVITTVLAGDIPESLLHSEDAQIFFGEVVAYHPKNEEPEIEVLPVAVIKGDMAPGTNRIYKHPDPMGSYKIRTGEIYLFTYSDDANGTDIFEVTTYDTRTLKLRHVKGDMWERFEKYLNEGKYGEARVADQTATFRDNIRDAFVIAACAVFFTAVIVYSKKKQRT